jgi:PKD repeat protein
VTQITGIPQGLAFECNNPGCNYVVTTDPLTQRGCVKICGTPVVPGNYNVLVSVIANVNTPLGIINQPSGFAIPLTIEPMPGGNCCFSYSPPSNCGPMDVEYGALFNFGPLQPTTWEWDFDNGSTSSLQNPPTQPYTEPGDYFPSLTTTVYNYVITDVTFTATGTGWCGDIEEPVVPFTGLCSGSPDMFFNFSNGNQTYQSSTVDNNLDASWSNLGLILENQIFSMQFWDEDNISQNDNLGIVSHNVTGPGTFTFSTFVAGEQEGFGSFTIALQVDTVYETSDTVSVHPIPPVPEVAFLPAPAVCAGDSILLSGPEGPYQYQWFRSSSFVSDSIATWVSQTGWYRLRIIDTTFFCQNITDSFHVQVLPFPSQPQLSYNSSTGVLSVTNNNSGHTVTWFEDGEVMEGETGNALSEIPSSGPFTVTFTNAGGCSGTSLPFYVCIPGVVQAIEVDTLCCGGSVNLSASGFTLNPFTTVAWAITPEAFGPVTTAAQAEAANNAGYVLGITNLGTDIDYTRNCNTLTDSTLNGTFWVTPFAIENPNVEPLTYDTLVGCRPRAEICPELNAVDDGWELFPMVFTFPDGSQLNANDAIAFGLPITQALIDFAGGLPCINLTDLFPGDPNGPWSVSITNTGTTDLEMMVPDFLVINYADTCELIDQDESYLVQGVTLLAEANGGTVSYNFYLPPLPGGFPVVSDNCAAFGTPKQILLADCFPELTSNLAVSGTVVNSTSAQSPNGYIDVTASGGQPPYSFLWADGPTTEDRFNLAPGIYSVTVTDNIGAQASGTWTVGGPAPISIGEQLELHGFALGNAMPNPFNHSTVIPFESRQGGNFLFEVIDIAGRRVASMEVKATAGQNRILLDGSGLQSGIYLYTLSNGTSVLSNRMVVSH